VPAVTVTSVISSTPHRYKENTSMKRSTLVLASLLALGLAACGEQPKPAPKAPAAPVKAPEAAAPAAPAEAPKADAAAPAPEMKKEEMNKEEKK